MSADRGIPRRDFLKSAVAIGGTAALSACLSRESVDVPTATADPSSYPERQHAWNDVLPRDDHGNVVAPHHRVLLYLKYSAGTPTDADRRTMERALTGVDAPPQVARHEGYETAFFEMGETSVDL